MNLPSLLCPDCHERHEPYRVDYHILEERAIHIWYYCPVSRRHILESPSRVEYLNTRKGKR